MASSTEQAIRITAQGEFGQLQRGLKDLQGDLKSVMGEIDKGARKGGIFDDDQLRALDIYRRRFRDTLEDLNREFEKQSDAVEALNAKMKKAYAWEQDALKEQIKQRRENLDIIDRTRQSIEQTYQRRNTEAQGYGSPPIPGAGGSSGGSDGGFAMLGAGSILSKASSAVGTIGKFALGLAGVGSLLSMATEAYQLAHAREVNSLDLAQRIRGSGGFSGSNSQMYDTASAVGRKDKMGYSQAESWQLQDTYTSEAGTLGTDGQYALQKFARGYGLDANTVGGLAGGAKQLGGVSGPKQFADMIATSVEKSGMTPRILEVMKTSNVLLQNLNTSFKDGSSAQIIAYQTTLDKLGNDNGMTRLTGAQGANVIGGLGGIYQPGNDKWEWMGISALQKYNPNKYKGMGLYDLESSFEDGMQNPDNIPAMAQYLKQSSGGNNDNFKRMMQSWLTDGGFKATKSEITELDKVTNGFTAFNPDQISKVLGTDSGAKYDATRKDEAGQNIMDVEAVFNKHLEELGQKILPVVTEMKGDINKIYEDISGDVGFSKTLSDIYDFLKGSGLGMFGSIFIAGKAGGALYSAWKNRNTETGLPAVEESSEAAQTSAPRLTEGPLTPEETAMLDSTASETGLNRTNLERAYRSHGDLGVDQFVHSGGMPPEGAPSEADARPLRGRNSGGGGMSGGVFSLLNIGHMLAVGKEAQNADPSLDYLQAFIKGNEESALGGKIEQGVVDPKTGKMVPLSNYGGNSNILGTNFSDSSNALSVYSTQPGSLASLSRSGTDTLDDLSTKGKLSLDDLKARGYLAYTNIETITSTKFDEIKQIHQTYFDSLDGGSGAQVSKDSDVRSMSGTTGFTLNSKLKGKLSGYGNDYMVAGNKYGIDPAFLAAISMQETGNGSVVSGNNVGGMMGSHGLMSFGSMGEGIDSMAANLKKYYIDQGLTTPAEIQKKYSPVGASNDPSNLNSNWLKGVTSFYSELSGNGSASGVTSDAFKDWKNKITSPFKARRVGANGNVSYHTGLDLAENQGSPLDALMSGKITDIEMDDGGQYDSDHKANTRMGGTEMVITMANGKKYSYSHMSRINPSILSQYENGNHSISVGAGSYVGNTGGDPSLPGSGYSTTGPHLHLGYVDADGVLQNPEDLLNSNGTGNTDILGSNMRGSVPTAGDSHITVDVNVQGSGVSQLNSMTVETIRALVQQGIEAYKRQELAMNPTARG